MGLFIKKYSIKSDKSRNEAEELFRENLDDMTKKGYSFGGNTVIRNSDHKSRYFSGEFKDGRWVFRQTDSAADDFYYRMLPINEVTFESEDNETKINVKSKSVFGIASLIVFLPGLIFAALLLFTGEGGEKLFALIPLGVTAPLIIGAVWCSRLIVKTKETLQYIFSK